MAKWEQAPEVKSAKWMEAPEVSKKEAASLSQALFPRASKAQGLGKKALGASLDVVSGVLRIPAAAGRTLDARMGYGGAEPQSFSQSLNQINQGQDLSGDPSRISAMTADASTPVSIAMPVAKVFQGAGLLSRIGQGAAAGGQIGGAGGLLGQADTFSQGQGFNPLQAAQDAGIGAATGGGLSAAGAGAKALGSKIVQSALKGGHTGKAEGLDVANVFKNNLGGSYAQMTNKTAKTLDKLKAEQGSAIAANANKSIPATQIFSDVETALQAELKAGGHFGDRKVIESTLKEYGDDLLSLVDPKTGELSLPLAHTLKKKLQSDAATLYRAAKAGKDTKAMASQAVAASLAKKLQEAIEAAAPVVAKPNKKFAEVIPIARALERRNTIAGQNNPIGLDELAALDVGAQFMANGQMAGGLLPFLTRALKSPYAGNLLYQTGNKAQGTGLVRMGEAFTPRRPQ
jgi:hypothetical protein